FDSSFSFSLFPQPTSLPSSSPSFSHFSSLYLSVQSPTYISLDSVCMSVQRCEPIGFILRSRRFVFTHHILCTLCVCVCVRVRVRVRVCVRVCVCVYLRSGAHMSAL